MKYVTYLGITLTGNAQNINKENTYIAFLYWDTEY